MMDAKAAGEKLTGPALVGLGLAGPLAQLAGAGAGGMNATGLKLPEQPEREMPKIPDMGELGRMTSVRSYGGWGDLRQQFGGGSGGGVKDVVAKAAKQQVEQNKTVIAKLDAFIKAVGNVDVGGRITFVCLTLSLLY